MRRSHYPLAPFVCWTSLSAGRDAQVISDQGKKDSPRNCYRVLLAASCPALMRRARMMRSKLPEAQLSFASSLRPRATLKGCEMRVSDLLHLGTESAGTQKRRWMPGAFDDPSMSSRAHKEICRFYPKRQPDARS